MKGKSELLQDVERVNALLREDAKKLKLGVRGVSLERMDAARGDLAMFSYWGKLEFREFCRRALEKRGSIGASELIRDGARMLKLSSETTKRYLRELRAAGGPLGGLGDTVILNARYRPVEEDDYWQEDEGEAVSGDRGRGTGDGKGKRAKGQGSKGAKEQGSRVGKSGLVEVVP